MDKTEELSKIDKIKNKKKGRLKTASFTFEIITLISCIITWTLFIDHTVKAYKFSQGLIADFIFNTAFSVVLSFIPISSIITLIMAILLWKRKGSNWYSWISFFTFSFTLIVPLLTLGMLYILFSSSGYI